MQQYLTINETAELLGFSRDWVYRIINTDETFPARRIGGRWRIDPEKLAVWVENQPGPGPKTTTQRKISGAEPKTTTGRKIPEQQYHLNIPRR